MGGEQKGKGAALSYRLVLSQLSRRAAMKKVPISRQVTLPSPPSPHPTLKPDTALHTPSVRLTHSHIMAPANPYLLACDNPTALLDLLRSNPAIASSQDEHGYSLLHAAASYGHVDLLRALVKEFNVDVNLVDEDGETCLFVCENPKVAQCLVEELSVDINKTNDEGQRADEKLEAEEEFPRVLEYLRGALGLSVSAPADSAPGPLNAPGPIPGNMQVNVGTMSEQEASAGETEVDPEFKRRIDELAAREDFHSEATQNELRDLVRDALGGSSIETLEREVRRRTD